MDRVEIDYALLVGRIKNKFKNQMNFAKAMGISESGLSAKLNNHRDFSSNEITKACKLLGLNAAEIPLYFFQPKVA